MRLLLFFAALAPLPAVATPQTLAWSGRLLDAVGDPLTEDVDLTVNLYADEDATDLLFTETFDALAVQGGYASVVLGAAETTLDDGAFAADSLWVQVAADESVLGPPRRLHGAPYAHTATRLGDEGSGLHIEEGGVVVEGDLRVSGTTTVESVQIGERYVLAIQGETCTNQDWRAVISNSTSHTLVNARMSFSHCEEGCHHAYREWVGFYNSYTSTLTMEDVTSYGSNAGTWSFTRDRTSGSTSQQTTFRKSADSTHTFCGDVNLWIESNKPIALISQSS